VSNRVSRRQGARWAAQDQQQSAAQQQVYEQGVQAGQASSMPAQRAAAPPTDDLDGKLERLEKLGQLRSAGVLTEEEFQAQKTAILNA
jgi:hypothetical protein